MARKLDILFVHTNAAAAIYQELSKEHSAIETPIWAGMLAQHCRVKGHSVQIIDCEAERLNYEESVKAIMAINPRIACFVVYGQQPSASTQNMEGAIATCELLKKNCRDIKTVFVGGHVAALPLESLSYSHVDFICQNEGVYTISDLLLCDDLEDRNVLKMVKGLGWKDDGKCVLNEINKIVAQENLSRDLPGIAWDLLPMKKYRTAGWHSWSNNSEKEPFASLYTSLGCPFKCFVPGTVIDGINKKIEDIEVGDKVLGYDEDMRKVSETEVIGLVCNETDYLFCIEFDNGITIKCTEEHPFYVRGEWIDAKYLIAGDRVLSITGGCVSSAEIKKVDIVAHKTKVYNFECYPHANYFVKLHPSESILSHNCSFCCINIINRQEQGATVASDKSAVFRHWEPEFIIKEFDNIVSYGIKNVKIADELFICKSAWKRVAELLIERNYGLNIWCYTRVDTCRESDMDLMKRAGINWVGVGVESSNQIVRQDVIKGGFKPVKVTEVMDQFTDHGINIGCNLIFGLYLDTQQTMQESFDFAMDKLPENCNMYVAQAYAGSPLYFQAKENGWQLPDCYRGYSQHSYECCPLSSKYLSAKEILRFRDDAWMKYNTNPAYLNKIESKFGLPARQDIERSTKIKLKRKLLGD